MNIMNIPYTIIICIKYTRIIALVNSLVLYLNKIIKNQYNNYIQYYLMYY